MKYHFSKTQDHHPIWMDSILGSHRMMGMAKAWLVSHMQFFHRKCSAHTWAAWPQLRRPDCVSCRAPAKPSKHEPLCRSWEPHLGYLSVSNHTLETLEHLKSHIFWLLRIWKLPNVAQHIGMVSVPRSTCINSRATLQKMYLIVGGRIFQSWLNACEVQCIGCGALVYGNFERQRFQGPLKTSGIPGIW